MAEKELVGLIDEFPTIAALHAMKAQIAQTKGDKVTFEKSLEKARHLDPDDSTVLKMSVKGFSKMKTKSIENEER